MSELLHLIRSVFVFLIELTVDVVCCAAYFVALFSGVRTFPALQSISRIVTRKQFRSQAPLQLLMTIYDFFAYSCFIISLLVPWRIYPAVASVFNALRVERPAGYDRTKVNYKVRWLMLTQALISLSDLVLIPLGLFPLFFPWRTYKVYKVCP